MKMFFVSVYYGASSEVDCEYPIDYFLNGECIKKKESARNAAMWLQNLTDFYVLM